MIFDKISKALDYRKVCPVCNHSISFKNKDLIIEYQSDEPRLRFNLSKEDIFYINTKNDDVEVIFKKSIFSNLKSYAILYEPIYMECQNIDCGLYSYIIQVLVDIKNLKVKKIILNSEKISYEDTDGSLHEIHNNYVNRTTNYNYFFKEKESFVTVPIININLNDLKQTVERVKNLLIFS